MKPPGRLFLPLLCLAAVHFIVLVAGFFAPYDPVTQDRENPSSPPTRIHWGEDMGHWHWRPFVYGPISTGETAKSTPGLAATYPVQLLPRGVQYSILGISTFNRHLFGVSAPARIHIMGTDNYGRDVFARLLYGGQISLSAGLLATILSLALAIVLGTLAGFYGSYADTVLMRGAEFFLALPWLYLLLAMRASLPLHSDPRQTFLLIIAVMGAAGQAHPWCSAQRAGTRSR
jgi:peptide/nickel transport system permease protein